MSSANYFFTSESVTEGPSGQGSRSDFGCYSGCHFREDPKGRVACETLVTTGLVLIAGEITTNCYVEMPGIVRQTIKEIGYNDSSMGFDWETCAVLTSIDKQSPDIAMGVNGGRSKRTGRRRPGDDVRLCLQRNQGFYAHAYLVRPSTGATTGGGSQKGDP